MLNRQPDTQLTPLERTIEQFIQANTKTVCYMSVRDLAEATFTSTAAIMRFTKKYDCQGFSEFKVRLRQQLAQSTQDTDLFNPFDESYLTHFIHNTTQLHFQQLLEDAIDLLIDKSFIYLLGMGSSKAVADYGTFYFSAFFSFVKRLDHPAEQAPIHIDPILLDKTAFIVCSVSGETREILDFIAPYHQKCAILSLTNTTQSTLAKYSDLNIPFFMPTQHSMHTKITSQVPALYTLELLTKRLKERKDGLLRLINE